MACLPLFSLPMGRSATRRDIPSSRARRPAIRRCGGPSSSTLHVSRRSGGASVRLLPPCTSVGDPAVLLSASYPCARQSAIRRCRTPPSPLPPCPGPVHVDWGLPARATRFTTHSPTLGTGFIADGTPKSRKRLPRPSSESVGLQSSSAGVRSQALVLLGSLHVELSSWRRGNHPPSSSSRHHRYRCIGWRSRSFYPPPWKNKTQGSHPPLQQCAPSPVLEQADGRPRPVFEGIGGRPPVRKSAFPLL